MSDPYRTSRTFVFSLDVRQISGIVAGAMAVLIIAFALGVGFGHRLAMGAFAPSHMVDLKKLDEKPATPVYTYAKELATNDSRLPPAAPKPATPAPAAKPTAPNVATAPVVPATKPTVAPAVAVTPPTVVPAAAPAAATPTVAEATKPEPAAVEEQPEVDPDAPKKDTHDRWTVQFGAPSRQKDADTLVKRLRAMGYDPFVTEADVEGKGHFYRVRIGRFPTRQEADKFRATARRAHDVDGVVMSAPADKT